jgi:hypothetical protein
VVQQPPYSPAMPPGDICPFLKLKIAIKTHISDDIGTIKQNRTKHLSGVPKASFKKMF